MLALADAVILSSGWTRRLLALLAGAFGALALAPIGFGPALVVPMVVAVWLLDGSSIREPAHGWRLAWPGTGSLRLAFEAGWWLGFGYFLAGFWWLGAAFLIDPEFAWALPLGVIGLPAGLAIFMGIGFVLARLLWTPGAARILALALGLGLSEWARGHLFTGFPWNPLGMGLGGTLVTAQLDSLVGLDGLGVLTVALCAAPATLCDGAGRTGLHWRPTLVALGGLTGIVLFGLIRLAAPTPADVPHVVVRIIQPGLRPDEKFIPENKDKIVDHYIELSKRDDVAKGVTLDKVTLLVWPESAFPFILTRDATALSTIGNALPPKTTLVTGAARQEDVPTDDGRPASVYYNAIEVIGSGGIVLDIYDKIHLVPFGEYLPFDRILRRFGLHNFVAIPGGFEPGTGSRRVLNVPGLPPALPLICYEAIFPSEVMPAIGMLKRIPRYLLNVTNDGWFGTTAGPWQHFAQARLRTIEQGLPLIRGTATGVSSILDSYGRIVDFLPLGEEGIIDGPLPGSIAPPFFARFGALATALVWLGTVTVYALLRVIGRSRA